MHTSTLVTAICTISLKAFCRCIKHDGNAINALHRHFSTSVHIWKSVYQYRKLQTFIRKVKMYTSILVTSICTISLKGLCRFIKHKRNALKDATSTLFHICSHLEKCISIQETPNLYMDGKNAWDTDNSHHDNSHHDNSHRDNMHHDNSHHE